MELVFPYSLCILTNGIGVPVFALSSNEPDLTKLGNRGKMGIKLNSCFYLKNRLLEYLHSGGEMILSARVNCAHMHWYNNISVLSHISYT